MKKIFFALFFLAINILAIHTLAFSQIRPDKYDVNLSVASGEETTGSLTIENLANQAVTLKAYFEDFSYKFPFDETKETAPLGSTAHSCGKWIKLSQNLFVIPAKGRQKIIYTVKTPKEAKGGYYGVLFFEKSSGVSTEGNQVGVGLVVRVGTSFFIETKNSVRKEGIEDISLENDKIKGYFVNYGNVLLIAEGSFYLMDAKGQILDRGEIVKNLHLPSAEKTPISINIAAKIPQGSYTLFINFDLGERKTFVKEVEFSKDEAGGIKILKISD